jgi:hypothetical protein
MFSSAMSDSATSRSAHAGLSSGDRTFYRRSLHPLHGMLLGAANAFLVSGFLSDWAYAGSTEIQWKNFASWLIIELVHAKDAWASMPEALILSGVAAVLAIAATAIASAAPGGGRALT